VNVFVKDGKRTYVAYRFGNSVKKIKFSDGFEMIAKPGMTVNTSTE
jgi:hypothetical protein